MHQTGPNKEGKYNFKFLEDDIGYHETHHEPAGNRFL